MERVLKRNTPEKSEQQTGGEAEEHWGLACVPERLEQGIAVSNRLPWKVPLQPGLWLHSLCACPEGPADLDLSAENE